ncbi:MAG TPA: helix-turn-helix transcriptional regulator [Solirubrobacteraceae bacterium]|jgi:transcriptional regulator with XRE-family HTH domain|nr:helix-turn-helix transcriptional regulator [Solirubrobacteraceae bacterium]
MSLAARHEPPDQALADALRRLRRASGQTQEHVAYEAGITTGALARIERGRATPLWTTVTRIVRVLGVSLAELVAEVEDARGRAVASASAAPLDRAPAIGPPALSSCHRLF